VYQNINHVLSRIFSSCLKSYLAVRVCLQKLLTIGILLIFLVWCCPLWTLEPLKLHVQFGMEVDAQVLCKILFKS